jgi:TonB family protein
MSLTKTRRFAAAALCLAGAVLAAQDLASPARYRGGPVPQLPTTTVGGGEVFVELGVDANGRMISVTPLRTTPPFSDLVLRAVSAWAFVPAEEVQPTEPARGDAPPARVPVASKILVAALFRPPTLNTPTFGEVPRDVAAASEDVALPVATVAPPYPPTAVNGGIVLLEASVDPGGRVDGAMVLRSAPPFDGAARDALMQWRFRPARWRGRPVRALVYVIFGFAVPIG